MSQEILTIDTRKSSNLDHQLLVVVFLLAAVAFIPSNASASSPSGPDVDVDAACMQATVADLNSTLRGHAADAGTAHLVRLDAPGPGWMAVDVSVPDPQGAEPRMAQFRRGCDESPPGRALMVERSTTHLVLAVPSAGSYYFRLGAQDPRQALGDYKLTSRFTTMTKGGEEEPDPNGLIVTTKGGEEEPDPNGLTFMADSGEEEPDPNGSNSKSMYRELCWSDDDHADTFSCAEPLAAGQHVTAELRNGWGDDEDVFELSVAGMQTVTIQASGEAAPSVALYDRFGHRLARTSADGSPLVTTLGRGRYFVRIGAAAGAEGAYELHVEQAAW